MHVPSDKNKHTQKREDERIISTAEEGRDNKDIRNRIYYTKTQRITEEVHFKAAMSFSTGPGRTLLTCKND